MVIYTTPAPAPQYLNSLKVQHLDNRLVYNERIKEHMKTKTFSQQHGFTVIEAIIIIGVVLVLGALAFIGSRELASGAHSSPVSAQDAKDAQRTAQAFYAAYTDSQGHGADILEQYATHNLLTASRTGSRSYSPIVCAQNVAPVSTGAATYKDGHFNVPVTLRFSRPLTFTVEVVKIGGVFKIDKVDCPQDAGGGE